MKRESVTGAGDPGEGVPTGAEERRRLPAKTRHDHSQKRRAPKNGARPRRGRAGGPAASASPGMRILPFFIKNRHSAIHMFFAYIVPFFSDKIE